MNAFLGSGDSSDNAYGYTHMSITKVRMPASTILACDGYYRIVYGPDMMDLVGGPSSTKGNYMHELSRGGINILFVDSHVSYVGRLQKTRQLYLECLGSNSSSGYYAADAPL